MALREVPSKCASKEEEKPNRLTGLCPRVDASAAALSLATRLKVDMPIAQATYDHLFDSMAGDQPIAQLMGRDPVPE